MYCNTYKIGLMTNYFETALSPTRRATLPKIPIKIHFNFIKKLKMQLCKQYINIKNKFKVFVTD